eukprot:862273-Prymnesium_polylepis.1
MFDPNHKSKNDAALAALVVRKFVGAEGMENIVVDQVEKMPEEVDQVEKNTRRTSMKLSRTRSPRR